MIFHTYVSLPEDIILNLHNYGRTHPLKPLDIGLASSLRASMAENKITMASIGQPIFPMVWNMLPQFHDYPLVNVYIAMERSTIFNGKIHYKYYKWPFSIAMLVHQRLSTEGKEMQILQTNAAWLHWRSVMLRQRNANETKSPGNSGGKLRITWHFREHLRWKPKVCSYQIWVSCKFSINEFCDSL